MTTVEGSAWVSRWLVENYTTTSSTNSTSSIAGEGNNGLGTPAIIGIIAACVVVAVLSVLGFLLVRRRNSRPNQGQAGLWDDDIITANRIPREKVHIDQLLSRGAFGEVYTGFFNSYQVAVKMMLPAHAAIFAWSMSFWLRRG